MNLQPIEKRAGVTKEEFTQNYLKESRPIVFKDLAANWQATSKWSFDYLKQQHGSLQVPVFDNNFFDCHARDNLTI